MSYKEEFRIVSTYRYPIKSGPGVATPEILLTPEGVQGSRNYCFYAPNPDKNLLLTCRNNRWMFGLNVSKRDNGEIVLSNGESLCPVPSVGNHELVEILYRQKKKTDSLKMVDCGDEVADWISNIAGSRVRLARRSEDFSRSSKWDKPLGIQDVAPIHGINISTAYRYLPRNYDLSLLRPDFLFETDILVPDDQLLGLWVTGTILRVLERTERCTMPNINPVTKEFFAAEKLHPFKVFPEHCAGHYFGVTEKLVLRPGDTGSWMVGDR